MDFSENGASCQFRMGYRGLPSNRGAGFQQSLHILSEDVGFQIDAVGRVAAPECGYCEGVGDEGDGKSVAFDLDDGQADAVHGDRSFRDHLREQNSRDLEPECGPFALFEDLFYGAGGIDVALDEVSAEACSGGECAFEVDWGACAEVSEVGFGESFGAGLKAPDGSCEIDDGEAASIDRDAFPEGALPVGGDGDA